MKQIIFALPLLLCYDLQSKDLQVGVFSHESWKDLEIDFLRIQVSWTRCPKKDGKYEWDPFITKIPEKLRDKPLPLFVLIKCGKHGHASEPPEDLKDKWDSKHGHSESYYDWVYNLVKEFGPRIYMLAIENEVNVRQFWTGTIEQYLKLLKTAYKAAHDARPDIIVTDSGFPSSCWHVGIAKDRLKAGKKPEEVYDFIKKYLERREEGHNRGIIPKDVKDMQQKIPNSKTDASIRTFFSKAKGMVDCISFHYYEPHEFFDDVVEWIRDQMKANGMEKLPIICSELGIRKKKGEEESFYIAEFKEKLKKAQKLDLKGVAWFPHKGDELNIFGFINNELFRKGFNEIVSKRDW